MIRPTQSPQQSARMVSTPGGIAIHYRVQVMEPATNDWRMHGAFRQAEQAEACLSQLLEEGHAARMICNNRCPVSL